MFLGFIAFCIFVVGIWTGVGLTWFYLSSKLQRGLDETQFCDDEFIDDEAALEAKILYEKI